MTESEVLETDIMFIQTKEIFKYIDKDLLEKIPSKIRNYITSYNAISNYSFQYDTGKRLIEQQISKNTKSLIALLDYNYWASEEDKKIIEKSWDMNESNSTQSVNDLFKKNNTSTISEIDSQDDDVKHSQSNNEAILNQSNDDTELIVKKESFFTRLLYFIKSIFKKEKTK